jgi:hypothetical protein
MDDLMEDQLHERLTSYAQAGARAARPATASAARGHGARLLVQRRVAQGSAALLLVAGIVGGAVVAGNHAERGVAPANGGGSQPTGTVAKRGATAGIEAATPPQVVRTAGAIELRGRTGQGQPWSYMVAKRQGGFCDLGTTDTSPPGAELGDDRGSQCSWGGGGFGSQVQPLSAFELNTVSEGCGTTNETDMPVGDDQWETLLAGLASPDAATVRLELLDGRRIETHPVATDLLAARPFAIYLNQCVMGTTTVAYRADGSVIARSGGEAPFPPQMGEWKANLTFDSKVTVAQRTELLVELERAGAQLYANRGANAKLYVEVPTLWPGVKGKLGAAQAQGKLHFTVSRSRDLTSGSHP